MDPKEDPDADEYYDEGDQEQLQQQQQLRHTPRSLKHHPPPNSAAYTERGHYKDKVILASASYDHTIRFWNADKGFCERIVQNNDQIHTNAMAITPNREILATAGFQHIRLFDIDSGSSTPLVNFEGVNKNATVIGFNQHGNWLYTGGEDQFMRVWDVRCRTLHCQRQRQFQTPINAAFLHPNGVEIYVADQSGSIYIWNLQNDEIQRLFITNEGFINSIAYDKDCRLLSALDTNGQCFIYKVSSYVPKSDSSTDDPVSGEMTLSGFLQPRIMFPAHAKYGLKCAFSPDSTVLATASADSTVKFWRTSDLTIANPTSVVKMDDPFEHINNAPTGPANAAGLTSSRAPIFQNAYSEDEAALASNSSLAILDSPYLAGLFSGQIQPLKPPPCYLKPRKLKKDCPVCQGRINSSAQVEASVKRTPSSTGGTPTAGRSMYHSAGCASASHSSSNVVPTVTSLIPLQPNLNSFSQLTWNFYGPKNSPGSEYSSQCNHYSHFSGQSKSTFRSKLSNENPADSQSSSAGNGGSSNGGSHGGHKHSHAHHPNHSHDHRSLNTYGQMPAYYAKYFDNKFYELHSRQNASDSEDEAALVRDEAAEDVQLFKALKQMRLLDPQTERIIEEMLGSNGSEEEELGEQVLASEESDEEDEVDGLSFSFLKAQLVEKRRARASKSKSLEPAEYCCCTCCEICNETDEQPPAVESLKAASRGRRVSGAGKQASLGLAGMPILGKNDWNFTNAMTPALVLGNPTQRWVWDIQFSADSQYIFTASSDQVVRLWSAFTGELTREYIGHQKTVTSLAFSDLL